MTIVATPSTDRRRDSRRKQDTARLFEEAQAAATEAEREDILHEIIVLNMGLARSLASRFRNRGVAIEDLEQVAMLSLVRIVPKYEPAEDRDFLSYAVPSIRGDLKRYFRDMGWTIKPPRRVQETQMKVRAFESSGERVLSAAEIARRLDLPVKDVEEAQMADGCFNVWSLDAPLTADPATTTLGETLPDGDDGLERATEARLVLEPLLRDLSDRDRRIVRLRFVDDCTQQQIADDLGVTQMQVSRLLARIMKDLRANAGDPES